MTQPYLRAMFTSAVLLVAALSASGAAITINGTGQNVSGGLDQSYQIISDTTGEIVAPAQAFIITAPGNWGPAIMGTSWIGPSADQSNNDRTTSCCTGVDNYQLTFSLAGLNPATASLNISYLVDNAIQVVLNGNTVYSNGGPSSTLFSSPITFAVNSGFVSGTNTLNFVVTNGTGPTVLDVGISGSASPISSTAPEPAAMSLFAIGLLTIGAVKRLRASK